MEKLELGIFGITINYRESNRLNAELVSDLKDEQLDENHPFNIAADAIESTVLGHFCAGVDVANNAYLEGVETACEAISNKLGDDQIAQQSGPSPS